MSVRMSYPTMRRLGGGWPGRCCWRPGAQALKVPVGELSTEPGKVVQRGPPGAPSRMASWAGAGDGPAGAGRGQCEAARTRASSAGSASPVKRLDAYDKSHRQGAVQH